jgi:hypothetical protein
MAMYRGSTHHHRLQHILRKLPRLAPLHQSLRAALVDGDVQPSLLRGEVGVGALGELEAPALEDGAELLHVRLVERDEDVVEVHYTVLTGYC